MKPRLPDGHRVRFEHHRRHRGKRISETGGRTVARVFDADGTLVAVGEARCCRQDHYSKRLGRDISLGRALKSLRDGDPTPVADTAGESPIGRLLERLSTGTLTVEKLIDAVLG